MDVCVWNRAAIKISWSLNERKTSHTSIHRIEQTMYTVCVCVYACMASCFEHFRMCSVNRLKIIAKSSGNSGSISNNRHQHNTVGHVHVWLHTESHVPDDVCAFFFLYLFCPLSSQPIFIDIWKFNYRLVSIGKMRRKHCNRKTKRNNSNK